MSLIWTWSLFGNFGDLFGSIWSWFELIWAWFGFKRAVLKTKGPIGEQFLVRGPLCEFLRTALGDFMNFQGLICYFACPRACL